MADVHSEAQRRRNMQAIHHRNTRPEILVRQLLHAQGFRFRLNVRKLPGTPDIVLAKYRAVVLINGCFWHGHHCYLFKLPRTRPEFWATKINTNRERDVRTKTALLESGWRVLIVWECAMKGRLKLSQGQLMEEISLWLKGCLQENDYWYKEVSCDD